VGWAAGVRKTYRQDCVTVARRLRGGAAARSSAARGLVVAWQTTARGRRVGFGRLEARLSPGTRRHGVEGSGSDAWRPPCRLACDGAGSIDGRATRPYAPSVIVFVSGIYECVGCTESIPPSGLAEVAVGLVVTAVFLLPGVLLHRFLRNRGR